MITHLYTLPLQDAEAAFDQRQEKVGHDSEKRGRNGAGKDHGVADHGDPAEDERAQAAGADGCRDGRHPYGDYRGGADPGENDSQRERQAHAGEDLRVGHAHGFGSFQYRGLDAGEADICVAKNGEQRVKHQRDDGGAPADATDKWNGNEKSEEREAGNGLKYAGDAESYGAQRRALYDKHAKRHADGDGDEHGD